MNAKKIFFILLIFSTLSLSAKTLPYPSDGPRNAVNRAPDTEAAVSFFEEKQNYDGALAEAVAFYPLDNWYFDSLLKKHDELSLLNTYDPDVRQHAETPLDAFEWYLNVADGSNGVYVDFAPYAQYIVSRCYATQCGTVKSYAEARRWAAQSFSAGFAGGACVLAEAKEKSWSDKSVTMSPQELYLKAAEQNFPDGLLSYASYAGKNAESYLSKASLYGNAEAYYQAARYVLSSATEKDIAEKLKKAEELLSKAAELFHPQSCILLGDLYARKVCADTPYSSPLCERKENSFDDQEKAVEYYTQAAMNGESEGFAALASIYREGYFDTFDEEQASYYYMAYRDAKYKEKKHFQKQIEELRNYYEKQGNKADETICRDLGAAYYLYPQDNLKLTAAEWLARGAQQGDAASMVQLAAIATENKQDAQALSWYKQALAATNAYPLSAAQKQAVNAKLDNIYAQVLQVGRFKADVDCWLTKERKAESSINKTMAKAATKREALAWFKSHADGDDIFYKTWYAWILLEDANASKYGITPISKTAEKDVKNAWGIISSVLKQNADYAPAIVCQGRCYQNGYGTRKKSREAKACYEKAAKLGYSEAYGFRALLADTKADKQELILEGCQMQDEICYYLSFDNAIYVPGLFDYEEALLFSTRYGYLPACIRLIDTYVKDAAVTFDGNYSKIDTAYNLVVKAEAIGLSGAKSKRLYIEKTFANKMESTSYAMRRKISNAQKEVQKEATAENLYALAQVYDTARPYVDGSDKQAATYYLQAANKGNVQAMEQIAEYYYYGKGIPQSYQKAFRWYAEAERNGSTRVYDELGAMFIDGDGCERDVEQGLQYFRMDCEQNPNSLVLAELNCFEGKATSGIEY